MLNLIIRSVAINAAYYTGEKLFQAGVKAAGAFKDSREARRAPSVAECLNGAPEPTLDTLSPFRVTVADRDTSGAEGWAVHDIYAVDSNDAFNWAHTKYALHETNYRVMVESLETVQ